MKTVLQEIIQWTIENAFNVEAQDGTNYVAIDHEEMRTKFDEWLQKDKHQSIDYHIGVMKVGLIEEGEKKWTDSYVPKIKEVAIKYYDETFNEVVS